MACAPSTRLGLVPLPRFAGEDHGEIVPQLILPRVRGRGTAGRRWRGVHLALTPATSEWRDTRKRPPLLRPMAGILPRKRWRKTD